MVAAKCHFILQRSTRGRALPLPHPFPYLLSFFGDSWVSFSRWFVIHSFHAYFEVSFVPGLAGAPVSLEGRTFWDGSLTVWHQRGPAPRGPCLPPWITVSPGKILTQVFRQNHAYSDKHPLSQNFLNCIKPISFFHQIPILGQVRLSQHIHFHSRFIEIFSLGSQFMFLLFNKYMMNGFFNHVNFANYSVCL